MKTGFYFLIAIILIMALLSACVSQQAISIKPSEEQTATVVPVSPGSGVSADTSDIINNLTEVSGKVKKVNGDLVLITLSDNGSDFMLRFSENTKWDDGVSKDIRTGNMITCMVKPEETFAPPSQGEVYEVISNES